jgi:flagellar hook-associated protein 1 FlgK
MSVSTFNGLNIALRGLLAQQRALDVTSHNIANAETPGYSRQEAVLATPPALNLGYSGQLDGVGAQLGQGVDVLEYRRLRDNFLDVQWRAQNMTLGGQQATADRLGQAEDVLADGTDASLGSMLDKFWSAWQTLANNPEAPSAKTAVTGAAQTLIARFKSLSSDLGQIATQATAEVTDTLGPQGPVQAIATELGKLNQLISSQTKNNVQPNDLLDRRDQLLDQLSSYGQVSVTPDATPGNEGMVTVSFGGATTPLVQAGTATVPTAAQLNNPGGRLGALLQIAAPLTATPPGTVAGYQATLDNLAASLVTSVNAVHPTAFLSGTDVASLALTGNPPAAGTGAAGDNSVATAIARLRGTAIDQGYAGLVQQIGGDSANASAAAATADQVVSALTERRQSVAGVSMDEEMTNMVRFQRGYQAAARALTTMDDVLDTLINRTGRVGL